MTSGKRKSMPKLKEKKETDKGRDRKPPLIMPCKHESTSKLRKDHIRMIDCPICGKTFKYEPKTIWKVKGVKVCSMKCRDTLMKLETM